MRFLIIPLLIAVVLAFTGCVPGAEGPDTTLGDKPKTATNETAATFTFTSDIEGATFLCKLDTADFVACQTPYSVERLQEGPHSFQVAAVIGGTQDPTPASYEWTIDLTPPDTMITSGPSGTVNSSEATFTYTASEANSTFVCQVDSNAPAACKSGDTFSGLKPGAHKLGVSATDSAGNQGPPATRTWTVDTQGPTVVIISGPANGTQSCGAATFTYSADENASFECSLDGSAFGACASGGVTYSSLGDGSHTFVVRGVDPLGNQGPPATRTWSVTTLTASTTITSPAENQVTGSTGTIIYSTQAGTNVTCTLDGNPVPCDLSGTYFFAGLANGLHTITIQAHDACGNVNGISARTWTVDAQGPTVSITSPAPSASVTSPLSVTFQTATPEDDVVFQCRIDGGSAVQCTSPTQYQLPPGQHLFQVHAIDQFGNVGPNSNVTFTVK